MRQKKAFAALGIIAYLAFLITSIPASQGIQWLQDFFPQEQVQISQPKGTIWSGSANRITVHQIQLDNVSWEIHPLTLLIGRLKLSIGINDQKNKASATIGFNTQGLTYIENLKGIIPTNILSQLPYVRNVSPSGSLALAIDAIHFSDTQLPIEADGEIIWHDAELSGPFSLSIGTLLIKLESQDDDIRIHIRDQDAEVKIDTTIVLRNDGGYKIQGKLIPKPNADRKLISTLALLGKKDSTGIIHVNYTGML
ncbi:MAG: type II secretion system protein N [Gammaproteobacteria bacterium]|nr:type II secretion system protein N [Gammaproteobacteria bacterium]